MSKNADRRSYALLSHILFIALVCLSIFQLTHRVQASESEWARVKWINDGDTIILSDSRRVRYIGINTPEIAHPEKGKAGEPYANQALQHNKRLVYRKQVRLEFDREKHDHYGRLLAYVFLPDDTFVNAELLRVGLGYALPKKPNERHWKILLKAQREAMTAGKGIWKRWRKSGEKVVGNRRSKRFHELGCPSADQIHPKNRVAFRSAWDAYWAGYAPAKTCPP